MINIKQIRELTRKAEISKIETILEYIELKITKAAKMGFHEIDIETWQYPSEIRNDIVKRLREGGFSVEPKYMFVSDPRRKYVISWK